MEKGLKNQRRDDEEGRRDAEVDDGARHRCRRAARTATTPTNSSSGAPGRSEPMDAIVSRRHCRQSRLRLDKTIGTLAPGFERI